MKILHCTFLILTATAAIARADDKWQTLDLTKSGLPIKVDVPACAKVSPPVIKIADNARDLMIQCEGSGLEPAFAIQIGLAAGKQGKKDIAADPNFKRWVKDQSGLLVWEVDEFGKAAKDLMLRRAIGKTEYICFSLFPVQETPLFLSELAACKSMRP